MTVQQPGDFFEPRPAVSLQHLRMTRTETLTQGGPAESKTAAGVSHLLDQFAAQRDVGAAEDVGHVSWDAQVIFFI